MYFTKRPNMQQRVADSARPVPPRVMIPVPGIRRPVGSGELLGRFLGRFGIPQCGGCKQRAERMNRWAGFRPAGWV